METSDFSFLNLSLRPTISRCLSLGTYVFDIFQQCSQSFSESGRQKEAPVVLFVAVFKVVPVFG